MGAVCPSLAMDAGRGSCCWFLLGEIPQYQALVTSVTGHQTACDLVKRFRKQNAEIRSGCSCDQR